jgi:hypothetical protein
VGRHCENWLSTLQEYVEETETPRHFWFWGGVFCIASALQRKVWLPFGMENLYPNLYIMLVAPPGRCRKGSPLGFARRILQAVQVPQAVDAPTKRAFTKELDELAKTQYFWIGGESHAHCSIAVVSRELSSFLAQDPKGMIECLTDIYDSHDKWEYKTSEKGKDVLFNVCVNCFLGTTPGWIANNLPEEAIGGGFTSRFAIVFGDSKYKWISLPPIPPLKLYKDLVHDLGEIGQLTGKFRWGNGTFRRYDKWYLGTKKKVKEIGDPRLYGYLDRMHVMVLKVAMCLHVARSEELVLEERDMVSAIDMMELVLRTAGDAFAGHGRSRYAADTDRVLKQVKECGKTTFSNLLGMNYQDTGFTELKEVVDGVVGMGKVGRKYREDGEIDLWWKGEEEK